MKINVLLEGFVFVFVGVGAVCMGGLPKMLLPSGTAVGAGVGECCSTTTQEPCGSLSGKVCTTKYAVCDSDGEIVCSDKDISGCDASKCNTPNEEYCI